MSLLASTDVRIMEEGRITVVGVHTSTDDTFVVDRAHGRSTSEGWRVVGRVVRFQGGIPDKQAAALIATESLDQITPLPPSDDPITSVRQPVFPRAGRGRCRQTRPSQHAGWSTIGRRYGHGVSAVYIKWGGGDYRHRASTRSVWAVATDVEGLASMPRHACLWGQRRCSIFPSAEGRRMSASIGGKGSGFFQRFYYRGP